MSYRIRKATPLDKDAIIELWSNLMDFHANLDSVFQMCSDARDNFELFLLSNIEDEHNKHVIVTEKNEEIVGYMMGVIQKNPPVFKLKQYGEILDACISKSYRRQGIGEQMVEQLIKWFKSQGIKRIDVNAAAKNRISNNFWNKMGFEPYLNHKILKI